jgi:hypothetical protein
LSLRPRLHTPPSMSWRETETEERARDPAGKEAGAVGEGGRSDLSTFSSSSFVLARREKGEEAAEERLHSRSTRERDRRGTAASGGSQAQQAFIQRRADSRSRFSIPFLRPLRQTGEVEEEQENRERKGESGLAKGRGKQGDQQSVHRATARVVASSADASQQHQQQETAKMSFERFFQIEVDGLSLVVRAHFGPPRRQAHSGADPGGHKTSAGANTRQPAFSSLPLLLHYSLFFTTLSHSSLSRALASYTSLSSPPTLLTPPAPPAQVRGQKALQRWQQYWRCRFLRRDCLL